MFFLSTYFVPFLIFFRKWFEGWCQTRLLKLINGGGGLNKVQGAGGRKKIEKLISVPLSIEHPRVPKCVTHPS